MKLLSMKKFFSGVAIATGLFTCGTTMAAVDMFLKMGDIKGESKDATHKDEIDVLAWSWGQSNGHAQTGRGVLPVSCMQDLSLTKYIDAASPQLILNGMTGEIVPTAVLTVRKAGDKPLEYLVITMTNVMVSSYSTGGSGGEDRLTENVTLHFDSMDGSYKKQKPDGTLDAEIVWNIGSQNSGACQ